jgi:hypothetical protein
MTTGVLNTAQVIFVIPSGNVNVAIENGPFIVYLPIKGCDFR